MIITRLSAQVRDPNRVNVFIDGTYYFSLDITQVSDLGLRVGKEYSEQEVLKLEEESQFGKVYTRALEFLLRRPHSERELKDYLYKKTRDTKTKTGAIKKGVSPGLTQRVYERLLSKGYVNDTQFARFWVENRQLKKGISRRKLEAELRTKGVDSAIITELLAQSDRSDEEELRKIVAKKAKHYNDPQKLMSYLARQGFSYDDIKMVLQDEDHYD